MLVRAIWVPFSLNKRFRFLSLFRSIYYLPAIPPAVAVALMWGWVFNPSFGLLNGTLYSVFHVVGPKWLVQPELVIPTMTIMGLWQFGGSMLIYLASLQNIPTQLYEAAKIDGANFWDQTL